MDLVNIITILDDNIRTTRQHENISTIIVRAYQNKIQYNVTRTSFPYFFQKKKIRYNLYSYTTTPIICAFRNVIRVETNNFYNLKQMLAHFSKADSVLLEIKKSLSLTFKFISYFNLKTCLYHFFKLLYNNLWLFFYQISNDIY
jgi:hypothetical protein